MPQRFAGFTRMMRLMAAAGIIVLFASCRPDRHDTQTMRVGLDQWAGYYPLVLADELGYLREAGVKVDIQFPQDTHRMIADFAGGGFDVIGVSFADVVITTRVSPDIRMILCSDESSGGDQILGTGPLTGNNQIHGKRIGTTVGGFGEIFVRRFLEERGVSANEVLIVNADAAAVPELLQRGEIDIGHTWEPYASLVRRNGWNLWFSSADTPGLIFDGLIVHHRLIESREPELRGLVNAWFRALDWWRVHPQEGNQMIERRLGLSPGSAALNGIRLLDRDENRRAFSRTGDNNRLFAACQTYVEFFVSRGMLGKRPKPEELLYPGFVE